MEYLTWKHPTKILLSLLEGSKTHPELCRKVHAINLKGALLKLEVLGLVDHFNTKKKKYVLTEKGSLIALNLREIEEVLK